VIFRAMAFLVALCAPALLLGCSGQQAQPYPTHVAFRPPEGFSGTGHLTPRTIYSIGVPPLHNVTSQAVHLRSVTLTQTSSALRPISYHAYSYRTSGGGVIAAYGDLAKNCPSKYVVQPVASVTVQPKADAASFIVVTLDPSRAGTSSDPSDCSIPSAGASKYSLNTSLLASPCLYTQAQCSPATTSSSARRQLRSNVLRLDLVPWNSP
jgi:hypothetical protein